MDKPLKSVTHGQCDARPTVTFPAAGHHRQLTGAKLHCLVTEARVCEQLAQGCYLKVKRPGIKPATFCVASQHPNHYTTRPLRKVRNYLLYCNLRNINFAQISLANGRQKTLSSSAQVTVFPRCSVLPNVYTYTTTKE